ncbi:MAG: ABC transporter permease [Campylobacter sp.]|nr:ABC transporter permease [Campylobacter sp.]
MFKRILAIAKKESLQASRDVSTFLIAILLPLMLLFLMGYALSLDPKNMGLGIANYSKSNEAKQIISKFHASKYFDMIQSNDKDVLMDELKIGKIRAILVIEDGSGGALSMQVISDGSVSNIGLINGYISSTIAGGGSTIIPRYFFNEKLESRYYLLPGSIAMVMTLIGTLLTALVVAKEYELGTIEMLFSTPIRMGELIIGKILPNFALSLVALGLSFMVAYLWYDIPFRGSFFMLILISCIYSFASLMVGILISALSRNLFIASAIAILAAFLPSFLLSGLLFEISGMPKILQIITHMLPAYYYVDSLVMLFMVGDDYGVFARNIGAMLIIGTLLFLIVMRKTKRSIE